MIKIKKIFAVLSLLTVFAVLVAPLAASAQNIAVCCEIRRTFTFEEDEPFEKGQCVAEIVEQCTDLEEAGGCENGPRATENWGMVCVLNTIFRVADLIFIILLAVAILLILLAAWTFLTAGGAPDKVNKARDYILYALIGLVVAFLARAIPSIVKLLL